MDRSERVDMYKKGDKMVRTNFDVLKIVKDKVPGAVWRPHLLVLTTYCLSYAYPDG